MDLDVDGEGRVYVADLGNNRVQVFSADGEFITAWGAFGVGDGQFDVPTGVAVDGMGSVEEVSKRIETALEAG